MSSVYLIVAIVIAFVATFLTRVIPFLLYAKKELGETIKFIELSMPLMIMVILIFYALKDIKFLEYPYGAPELICIVIAGILHIRFRSALFSIVVATVSYMLFIQILI